MAVVAAAVLGNGARGVYYSYIFTTRKIGVFQEFSRVMTRVGSRLFKARGSSQVGSGGVFKISQVGPVWVWRLSRILGRAEVFKNSRVELGRNQEVCSKSHGSRRFGSEGCLSIAGQEVVQAVKSPASFDRANLPLQSCKFFHSDSTQIEFKDAGGFRKKGNNKIGAGETSPRR